MQKIIAVVGPTSSGKTNLSLKLAKAFKGEVISADSRQVYRGFDLCSGKIAPGEMMGVKHHLLSIASPNKTYTVARFIKNALAAIKHILENNSLPIVAGGTGLYLDALLQNQTIPNVKPNPKLRRNLEKKTAEQLFARLKQKDPARAQAIDQFNPRRLIRALEIAQAIGKTPPLDKSPQYQTLYLGLNPGAAKLRQRIKKRLQQRLKQGMVQEIKKLHDQQKLSWPRLESFGLELKYVSQYLQGKISEKHLTAKLNTEIYRYAKRQLTWFRRNKNIHWLTTLKQARKLTKDFLAENQKLP